MPKETQAQFVYVVMGSSDDRRVLGWPVFVFTDRDRAEETARFAQRNADQRGVTIAGRRPVFFVYESAVPVIAGRAIGPVDDLVLFTGRRALSLEDTDGE